MDSVDSLMALYVHSDLTVRRIAYALAQAVSVAIVAVNFRAFGLLVIQPASTPAVYSERVRVNKYSSFQLPIPRFL